MDEKKVYFERIQSLISTGDKENIDLALQLAKGQGFSEEEVLKGWDTLLEFICTMEGLPYRLVDVFNLETISYYNKLLYFLPRKIGRLFRLKELQINTCLLQELPDEVTLLKNLERLNLTGNNLSDLPDKIGDLSRLEHLELTRNNISDLPDSFVNLKSLKSLDLYFNPISVLPDDMNQLTNLKRLSLGKTTLWSFGETIEKLIHTNLENLALNNNNLEFLPPNIQYLKSLTTLNLTGNNFPNKEKERLQSLLPNCKIYF